MKLENSKKIISASIFECFNKLISKDDNDLRIKGAYGLIKILEESDDNEKSQKQLEYSLKRLVRGNGSTSNSSRIGFHVALNGLLNSEICSRIKIKDILELVANEYHASNDKIKMDALIGTALVCGAIIRSKLLQEANKEELTTIVKHLTSCLNKPAVYSLAFNYLNELVIQIDTDIFSTVVWPEVKIFVNHPKDTLSIDAIYFLMLCEEHHKGAIESSYYKKHWPNTTSILSPLNFNELRNVLWNTKKATSINHPFYEYFVKRLVQSKYLKSFWNEQIEANLKTLLSQNESITMNVACSILKYITDKPSSFINILTANFMDILIKNESKSIHSEDDQEIFNEFYDLVNQKIENLKEDNQKLHVFNAFVNHPGGLLIDKSSNKKFITNLLNSLEQENILKALTVIREIIVDESSERNIREKLYAGQMLYKVLTVNKTFSTNIESRINQLKFLVNIGIFKSSNGVDVIDKLTDSNSKSLATNMRNIFYHCLEYKFSNLEDERKVLIGIVDHINVLLSKNNANDYLHNPLKKECFSVWQKMYKEVKSKMDKKTKKLTIVFHILLTHMGLQLFNNSEMAENAINELECVISRINKQQKNVNKEEPEWIEVVIDLFLNLLSQNSFVLRNVIRHVFPQLCNAMTLTACHQILALLDVKSKENPLLPNDADNEDDSEDDDDDEDMENEDESDDDEKDSDNGDENDEDEEDIDEDDDIEDETETINDTVRLAIQNALGSAAAGDDVDIDIDDIDEEEGAKLDDALSNAFKLLKQNRKPKKTKAAKIADTTLLHFRMRIIDLIEMYLKNSPQMEICLEIIVFLYELMPIAYRDEKNKQLANKFNGLFDKIALLKGFTKDTIINVTEQSLAQTLRNLLERTIKDKSYSQQAHHFSQMCMFLINCSQNLNKLDTVTNDKENSDSILKIFVEHLTEFYSQRNPALQLITYRQILETKWIGNFKIAEYISDFGLKTTTRTLRRTQSLQLLKIFYKNRNLLSQSNDKSANESIKQIENNLKSYINSVENISQPEFVELLQLVVVLRNYYKADKFVLENCFIENIPRHRKQIILNQNSFNIYRNVCQLLKLKVMENGKLKAIKNDTSKSLTNGKHNGITEDSDEAINNDDNDEKQNKGVKRQKVDSKKEKKLRKLNRLQVASQGFNDDFSFANTI